jgi:2-oxoglutarate dehydrogenase E1 component
MPGKSLAKDDIAMIMQKQRATLLSGGNAPYVEELYEAYLADAGAVSDEWRDYFDTLGKTPAIDGAGSPPADAGKQIAVQSLVAAYRMVGTRQAKLDPLQWTPVQAIPDLDPGFHGLTNADMPVKFNSPDTYFQEQDASLSDLLAALEETYCGTLSAEFMHLTDASQRRWWEMRLESARAKSTLSPEKKRHILERLTAAEGLEKYLHVRYTGQKRFSLEGGESLIVLLDEIIRHGASQDIRSVVMGMAHRGRLNVLINTAGKPPSDLFDEFDGKTAGLLPAGDVKYHKGYTGVTETGHGPVEVVLAFNASHLEFVNPVVQGIARAKREALAAASGGDVLAVEIHGDAAISGQGIVMETLSLTHTPGYGTGGTVHVVVNNQVGFTTSDPDETRSSFYCTDIAKMIEAPVLHVNGDDPEAVVNAVQLALDYRAAFQNSVFIDLVCFRRHGHQEQDTPNITQPLMYRAIAANPGVRTLYARKLIGDATVTVEQAEGYALAYRNSLDTAEPARQAEENQALSASPDYAAPALDTLRALASRITEISEGHALHPLVAKVMSARRDMATGAKALDWGMAEHLAFASLLATGVDVRLSGEDSERGTFSHRHAVLNDQNRKIRSEGRYVPLSQISPDQGQFTIINSILSEAAVLGFEYGYSIVRPDALVLWEAQFGDFANGAQVVIDQFIASAAVKWGQRSGLTLLLPHGQEGQGPEHASARLERYLQLCAQDNMQVCQPTTPAQFFHLLRVQAMRQGQRPLIVMTPKSLLRHPEAVSSLGDLASGTFLEVLGDLQIGAVEQAKVKRVILCSGKIYYELLAHRASNHRNDVALIRLEQLYPFPAEQLAAELARFGNAETFIWCQEEARNQGAWKVIDEDLRALVPPSAPLRYAGPPPSASTAPGYASAHTAIQKALVRDAFGE